MKKLFPICLSVMMLLALSCIKDPNQGEEQEQDKPKPEIIPYGVDGLTPLPEAVDIGTVVNGRTILWASFNLGARKEYEYGDYYSWGETWTKAIYSSLSHAFYVGDEAKFVTKYCPYDKPERWGGESRMPDGLTVLQPDDDVAHVKLGGDWRMPSYEEFEALFKLRDEAVKEGSDYTWEDCFVVKDNDGQELKDASGNVLMGTRITRKSTGATLFFPLAGSAHFATIGMFSGSEGIYWTTGVNTDDPVYALCEYFRTDRDKCPSHRFRFDGLSIRPVCTKVNVLTH